MELKLISDILKSVVLQIFLLLNISTPGSAHRLVFLEYLIVLLHCLLLFLIDTSPSSNLIGF